MLIRRLPRIATDQTMTLMPLPAEHALDMMLAVVREVRRRGASRRAIVRVLAKPRQCADIYSLQSSSR